MSVTPTSASASAGAIDRSGRIGSGVVLVHRRDDAVGQVPPGQQLGSGRGVVQVVRRDGDAVGRGEQPADVVQHARGEGFVHRFAGVPGEHAARACHGDRVQPQPFRVVGRLAVEHQIGDTTGGQRTDQRPAQHHRGLPNAADAPRVAEMSRVGRSQHAGRQRGIGHDRLGDVSITLGTAEHVEDVFGRRRMDQESISVRDSAIHSRDRPALGPIGTDLPKKFRS
jgi:hypothetical protein